MISSMIIIVVMMMILFFFLLLFFGMACYCGGGGACGEDGKGHGFFFDQDGYTQWRCGSISISITSTSTSIRSTTSTSTSSSILVVLHNDFGSYGTITMITARIMFVVVMHGEE